MNRKEAIKAASARVQRERQKAIEEGDDERADACKVVTNQLYAATGWLGGPSY